MTPGKAYRAELQRGLVAGLCSLAACIPNAGKQAPPTGFCVRPAALCTPDPGPQPVNCADAEAGLEFAPFMIADFEETGNDPNGNSAYLGQYMYSYTDATAQIYANGDNGTQFPAGYAPVAETAGLCSSGAPSPNHILHVSGGPFLGWGGGLGVAMEHITQSDGGYGLGYCPVGQPAQYDFCPPAGSEDAVALTTLDMSLWDGVAVWARRGPDSQPLLRVLVGNKYVDEDVSFLQYGKDPSKPRYCERARECVCVNGKDCKFWAGSVGSDAGTGFQAGYYCGDPAADPPPGTPSGNGVMATNGCNITQCNQPYPAYATKYTDPTRCQKPADPVMCPDPNSATMGTDPQFYKRPCTPYAFRSGLQSSYCWDPDPNHLYVTSGRLDPNGIPDLPPAESDQQCGDYWTFPLHLTTEWQLFLVPFTTMYQQGWAKRWPFFDTASVSVVRLTWDAGWVDYWIDNLRFYRVRR